MQSRPQQPPQPPIVLWAVPRSRSTAFERIFIERDDFTVLHEPFSATYYHSTERRSDSFLDGAPNPDATAEKVLAELLKPHRRRVFVKDMAYHATAFMDATFVGLFANSFLIRHPRAALASLHAKHPHFTFEEAGYEQLARLYDYATRDGASPPVIDSDDLVRHPETVVRAYCAALDIPFVAKALSWQPQKVDEFATWSSWHQRAQRSDGFDATAKQQRRLPSHLEPLYERCLAYYQQLRAHRLVPSG